MSGKAMTLGGKFLVTAAGLAVSEDCCCEVWEIRDCPSAANRMMLTETDLSAHVGDVIRFTGYYPGGEQACGIVTWLITGTSNGPVTVIANHGGDCAGCSAALP